MFKFNDVFTDCTKYVTKLKTSEYKESGKNIIIDQGQNEIAGYTNNEEGLFEDIPALIFGDHTRCIKYINKPFYIGADGVKILKIKLEKANYKYWYYALKNINIPNTGYNRHFKWLKGLSFKKHTLIEQQKIVDKLDIISVLINQRQLQLKLLDDLIKARFVEMFNGYDKIKLSEIADIVMGQSPDSSSYNDEGDGIPFFQGKADYGEKYTIVKHWTNKPRKLANKGDILMSVRAPVGPVNISSVDCCIGRGLCSIKAHERVTNNEFLYNALKVMENNISSLGTGTTFKAINKKDVYSLMIPNVPFILQEQFSDFVKEVDKSKFEVQKSLEKTQQLYDCLMQKYFG